MFLNQLDVLKIMTKFVGHGFHGYVGYDAAPNSDYGIVVSFYTAAWPLINQPLHRLQIGLPGTWISPNSTVSLTGQRKKNQLCNP